MKVKNCLSAQSPKWMLQCTLSLFLLVGFYLFILPAQAGQDANQIEAANLLQTSMGQSLRLEKLVLESESDLSSLELQRFEVFAPDVRITVRDGQGNEQLLPRPATAYFQGHIVGDPQSLVVLSADSGTIRGLAQRGKKLWILASGVAAGGPHLGLVSREVAQSGGLVGAKPFHCGFEGRKAELTPPVTLQIDPPPAIPLTTGQFYQVPVAIETDGEFYNLFGNSNAATSYIGDLFAYASVIYNREAKAKLIVGDVSLWAGGPTSDPWNNHANPFAGLQDFQNYWNANRTSVKRATAHFLSGRNLGGGVAYVGVLCNKQFGYGYSSSLEGQFQISNPKPVWDVIVVAHEIGHNFSSEHTHCYANVGGNSNPVDACYAVESGCWNGSTSLPGVGTLTGGTTGAGNGTIMSYCQLLNGGISNIALTFGQNHIYGIAPSRVSSLIAGYVASSAASFPSCITIGSDVTTTYTLTLTKAGTGTGVISSGGSYAAGAAVTLTATADPGSTFAGWSPSPCAASFAMPTSNLACTATFNLTSQTAKSAVGVFRNGEWFLDADGDGAWDGCGTEFCFSGFGQAGDRPASGNWNGGTKSYIGVLRSGTGEWFIDRNGNRQWDGCGTDGCYVGFGAPGDLPVAGDWNGRSFARIGVFRNGQWFLDDNGNGQWDDCSADLCLNFGQAGDLPAAGNWDGGVPAGVGVFRNGTWFLDYNGNGQWDGCDVDRCYVNAFGQAGDLPAAGDWNGDGKAKVGVFRNGTWFLDYNGNGQWDGCGTDRCYEGSFGQTGDLPVAGKW